MTKTPSKDDPSNPFWWLNAVNSRRDVFGDYDRLDELEKQYNAFMVNRGLSMFPDTIMYANEMNQSAHVDRRLQFDYLISSIRPSKRFSKWPKKKSDEDLEVVMEYFGYGPRKAQAALSVLTAAQLVNVKERMLKGGKT